MLCDFLGRSNAHLSRFERFQATSHGPLEDLLHLVFTLVNGEVSPAVPVAVLWTEMQPCQFTLLRFPPREVCRSFALRFSGSCTDAAAVSGER